MVKKNLELGARRRSLKPDWEGRLSDETIAGYIIMCKQQD